MCVSVCVTSVCECVCECVCVCVCTSYGGVQVSNTVASQPASSLLPVLLQRSSMVTFDEGSPLHDGVEHTDSGYLLTHSLTH